MSLSARATRLLGLAALTALLLASSCSGDAFVANDSSAAGEASAGAPASAGSGGIAGSETGHGGALHSAGEANAGGATSGCSATSDCAAGQFCRDGACVSCADLSDLDSLAYGPAEPFELINASGDKESLRFPRRLHAGSGLVYVRDFFGGALWFTTDPSSSAGGPLSKIDVYENGCLPFGQTLPEPLAGMNFFFSRRARSGDDAANTRLFGAVQAEDGSLSGETQLPAPFNSEQVVASHGLALSAKRAVWMRNLDGMLQLQLVTSPLPPQGEPTELRLPLPNGCGFAGEFDFAAWLTADGSTLFFNARRVDQGCMPAVDAVTHLYVLELSPAGQPIGAARVLTDLADPDARQGDPSLSPDACELLFSAQSGNAMRLFRAPRRR